jgi:rubredoxin
MPTLTHILAAALVLAAVLIHAVWRWGHQSPPVCGACGLLYCPGGAECVMQVVQEQQQDSPDYWMCSHCRAHFNEAWLSFEAGPPYRDGVDCPECGAFIADEELVDELKVWRDVCEGIDSRMEGK